MEEVVISLLAPGQPRQIQHWVAAHVDEIRAQGRINGVRLGRLAPSSPARGGHWMITVDRDHRDVALEDDRALGLILTDLALLGLRPYLFVISRAPDTRRSRDTHRSDADAARRGLVRSRVCRRPA